MMNSDADGWDTGEWPHPAPMAPSRRGQPAPVEQPAAKDKTNNDVADPIDHGADHA